MTAPEIRNGATIVPAGICDVVSSRLRHGCQAATRDDGRGDSALPVIGAHPQALAELRAGVAVVTALANGREAEVRGQRLRFARAPDGHLDVWVAADGAKAVALRAAPAGRRSRRR
jgi:hypothetical protein